MKLIIALIFLCLTVSTASADKTTSSNGKNKIDIDKGIFAVSWGTISTGNHGIKARRFMAARPPVTTDLKHGWNHKFKNGRKDGLQIYINKNYIDLEYFENGKKISTASFIDGKPDGWFLRYKNNKKNGLQHYFNGGYQRVEVYKNGKLVLSGDYRNGQPSGWFHKYENGNKHGIQRYVDGDYWSMETYSHGKKNGFCGSFRGNKKSGWHYIYQMGEKIQETYYVNDIAQ